jgi:hypothetical protein
MHPGAADLFVLQRQQVGLGHHARDAAPHHQHRHAADPPVGEQADDLADRGEAIHRHDLLRHHVPNPRDVPELRLPVTVRQPADPHRGCGPGGSLPVLGPEVLVDHIERSEHIGAGRPAVQGVVIRGTQVPELGIKVNISSSHDGNSRQRVSKPSILPASGSR